GFVARVTPGTVADGSDTGGGPAQSPSSDGDHHRLAVGRAHPRVQPVGAGCDELTGGRATVADVAAVAVPRQVRERGREPGGQRLHVRPPGRVAVARGEDPVGAGTLDQVQLPLVAAEVAGALPVGDIGDDDVEPDRKSTRLNSSHVKISYAVFCLKKKKNK